MHAYNYKFDYLANLLMILIIIENTTVFSVDSSFIINPVFWLKYFLILKPENRKKCLDSVEAFYNNL
jgi:hypothetical protein